jgi:hypothetical protein
VAGTFGFFDVLQHQRRATDANGLASRKSTIASVKSYIQRGHLVIHEKAPDIQVRTGVIAVALLSIYVLVENAGVEPQWLACDGFGWLPKHIQNIIQRRTQMQFAATGETLALSFASQFDYVPAADSHTHALWIPKDIKIGWIVREAFSLMDMGVITPKISDRLTEHVNDLLDGGSRLTKPDNLRVNVCQGKFRRTCGQPCCQSDDKAHGADDKGCEQYFGFHKMEPLRNTVLSV